MPSSSAVTGSGIGTRRAGGQLLAGSPVLDGLCRDFRRQHYVSLPGFFDRMLLDAVAVQIANAEFAANTVEGISTKWVMAPNALGATLNWLVNAPELLRAVQTISGDAEIGFFAGRVYRMDPDSGQSFDWHHDREHEDRRLVLTVNLGERPYSGGVLQLRGKSAPDAIAEVPNVGPGDAVVFRVSDDLEHCVTPVEGVVPKLAFSGWFQPGPSYHTSLMEERKKLHDAR